MTCFSFLFSKRGHSSRRKTFEADDEVPGIHNVGIYTYKELGHATNDFSPANKIGEGGFGSVYKGKLKDGRIAAIKVLSAESRQGVKEFLTEIRVISDIMHENLVKLYGCCVEGNHRILVYNYLENNSLAQTLLGKFLYSLFICSMEMKPCLFLEFFLYTAFGFIIVRKEFWDFFFLVLFS